MLAKAHLGEHFLPILLYYDLRIFTLKIASNDVNHVVFRVLRVSSDGVLFGVSLVRLSRLRWDTRLIVIK